MSDLHEECGVFGIYSETKKDVAWDVYCGLFSLQHRGQEAAGIAVNEDRNICYHKGLGLVHEVFDRDELSRLGQGQIAVGHVRYATTGDGDVRNAQPMVVRHIKGQLAVCHNGNLVNSKELRSELELKGCIFHTTSDTEVISYIITQKRLVTPSIEEAVCEAMKEIRGAYSLVMMSPAKLIACRDPWGFRPLCMGRTPDGDIVFSSETCGLDTIGAEFIRDIKPGEIVVVDEKGIRSITTHCDEQKPALCVFEYIYFARPDSVIEGMSVHESRKLAGRYLAKSHPVDADIVVGVPDSGLDAALGYSEEAGIPYEMGLIRNKYIGRTFIAPEESGRGGQVDLKLNAASAVVKGKRVVLIDDSIVRGTTSARIVRMLKNAGAKEVHMRISSPPFLHPCYYGTDVDSDKGLIAKSHTVEEICDIIGADSLGYLSMEDALHLVTDRAPDTFCAACFKGDYPA
ncbi:MAG: amidophosphoribosyltransferase [Lachnospiraceae bacterium]|nr:amidophosphoribosyltransferase [Lachnospiraceae bacterium]